MKADLALLGGSPLCDSSDWPRWPVWDTCEAEALQDVLASGQWQSGPRVAAFEAAFARYQGAEQAICVTNGTTTLEIALRALGAGPGDEVIVPSYTFAATALAVMSVGAIPVFVDSDPEHLNLAPDAVAAATGPNTVGMIPVHVGGHPVDYDALEGIARRHGLFLLEDAAHAHGAEWRGQRIGALGHLGSYSFQTGKSLTSGDGGCLVTSDLALADACRSLRNFGRDAEGRHARVAGNARMTEFQAAVLQCQLARLDQQIARRHDNLARLTERLAE
ncbi:MAG TPA: DegT/DnrJ/EryC1/StrS family aminotransferase, partial [Trueperaceae bacterium]